MRLVLHVPGASAIELARGVSAAQQILDKAKVTPWSAAVGAHEIETWDDRGFPDDDAPDEETRNAGHLWFEAEATAIDACREGWPKGRRTGHLELRQKETSVARQIRDATKHLIDWEEADSLWRILRQGGLSATVLLVHGLPQVQVQIDGEEGEFAKFGKLVPGDPATSELERLAQAWSPLDRPSDAIALAAWHKSEALFKRAAWHFLDQQIRDRADFFVAAAREWQD